VVRRAALSRLSVRHRYADFGSLLDPPGPEGQFLAGLTSRGNFSLALVPIQPPIHLSRAYVSELSRLRARQAIVKNRPASHLGAPQPRGGFKTAAAPLPQLAKMYLVSLCLRRGLRRQSVPRQVV
jgi:hypothetical protein